MEPSRLRDDFRQVEFGTGSGKSGKNQSKPCGFTATYRHPGRGYRNVFHVDQVAGMLDIPCDQVCGRPDADEHPIGVVAGVSAMHNHLFFLLHGFLRFFTRGSTGMTNRCWCGRWRHVVKLGKCNIPESTEFSRLHN